MVRHSRTRGGCALRFSATNTGHHHHHHSPAAPFVDAESLPGALVSTLDHVIWSVANLDGALERLTRRMGFALAEPPVQRPALRTATVCIGGLPVRLVEKAEWQTSQPISVALRSHLPLTEAEAEARARDLNCSGIFMIAGPHNSGAKGGKQQHIACLLLSDVVAPGDPGLMVVQYMGGDEPVHAYGGRALGIAPEVRTQVDVSSAAAMMRWRKVLGTSATGLLLRAGERDGIASLLLRAANLWNLQTVWKDAGVDCDIAGGKLIVDPAQTGGLPIEVEES